MARRKEGGSDENGSRAIDSILFKFLSRLVVALIVILVFLTLAQCTIKKPQSPVGATNFTVPVINSTSDMAELIKRIDQTGVAMDPLGNVTYTIFNDLDTVTVCNNYVTTSGLTVARGFQEVLQDTGDFKLFGSDALFFDSTLNLAGTGGQLAKLTANENVNFSGQLEISNRFDGEF